MSSWETTKTRHGTPSGSRLHIELKEKPCDACARAKRLYDQRRKSAGPAQLRARQHAQAQMLATKWLRNAHHDEWLGLYRKAVAEVASQD